MAAPQCAQTKHGLSRSMPLSVLSVHESKCGTAAMVNVELCGQKKPSADASG
jgi:hypothetical protein